jgi:hypothetical protein
MSFPFEWPHLFYDFSDDLVIFCSARSMIGLVIKRYQVLAHSTCGSEVSLEHQSDIDSASVSWRRMSCVAAICSHEIAVTRGDIFTGPYERAP